MTSSEAPAGGNVRIRRLKADYDRLLANLEGKTRIKLLKTIGNPPEKYQLEYLVKSLIQDEKGNVRQRSQHQVELVLTRGYPRQAPQCRMLTPVFHPNIAPHAICVGDHWAAGETLGSLVVRIAEMLAFQSYNLKSPLNGEAARWVSENEDKLPLDEQDFSELLEASDVASAMPTDAEGAAVKAPCANCSKPFPRGELSVCSSRHLVCKDCKVPCTSCERVVCLKCRTEPCAQCQGLACVECLSVCAGCKRTTCAKHHASCVVCSHSSCSDCYVPCLRCKKPACLEHIVPIKGRDAHVCQPCAQALRAAARPAPQAPAPPR